MLAIYILVLSYVYSKQPIFGLTEVVYTLHVHIDSTKEIKGRLSNCSHINETVGSYQPFHDHIGHGVTIV